MPLPDFGTVDEAVAPKLPDFGSPPPQAKLPDFGSPVPSRDKTPAVPSVDWDKLNAAADMQQRAQEYTQSLKSGDFARSLLTEVPGDIANAAGSLFDPIRPFLNKAVNTLVPYASEIPDSESLFLPPISDEKRGFGPGLYRLAEGLTTKENLALMPLLPESDMVKLAFQLPAAAGAVQGAAQIGQGQVGEGAANVLGQGLFAYLLGRGEKAPMAPEQRNPMEMYRQFVQSQPEFVPQQPRVQQPFMLGLDRVLPKAEPPPQVERPPVVATPPAAPPVAATAPTLPVFEKPPVVEGGDLTNLGHELKGLAQGILYARAKTKEPVDPALLKAVQEGGNQIWAEANQPGADLNELHQRVADLKGQLSGRIPFFGESKETGPSKKVGEIEPPTLTSATQEGPVYPLGRSEETGTLVDKMGRPVTGQSRRLATPEELAQGPEAVAKMAPEGKGSFYLETPDYIRGQRSLFGASHEQVLNTLRNKFGAEYKMLEDLGVVDRIKQEKPKDVAKFIEDNGPKVEVHTYGMEGKVSEARKEYDNLTHEWFDNLPAQSKQAINRATSIQSIHKFDFETILDYEKALDYRKRQEALMNEPASSGPRATSAYSHVSPEDVKKFPVQRVDVTVPFNKKVAESSGHDIGTDVEDIPRRERVEFLESQKKGNVLWPPDSIHEQLPNTLGWAAIQYKMVGGEKVAHVFEVQSRWGQTVREQRKQITERAQQGLESRNEMVPHPLLHDYNRLILKAAIEQARKEGATKVVVTDSKTGMLSEGLDHDHSMKGPFDNRQVAEQAAIAQNKMLGVEKDWKPFDHSYKNLQTGEQKNAWYISDKQGGFDFNYDTILPKIMEELTGGKGEKVELGEHKNAFEKRSVVEGRTVTGAYIEGQEVSRPRENLIFRNPDGTPKTSVTGLAYDIRKTPETFSLLRNKYSPEEQLPIHKRFDVRTEEGRRAIALRSPKELLGDFGIDPGIARWKGAQARNQGPQAYTRFEKLSLEQMYDKWDEVKRVYESRTADWKKQRVELHPDKGGDAAAFAEASARHDTDEAIFKELQRHFDARGVETGFDRAEYQLSKTKKKDEQIADRFKTQQLKEGGKEAPTPLRETLPSREARQFDALGLGKPQVTALDVVDRMAGSKEFSSSGQALAQFLKDNFAHVLRLSQVSPEKASARGRAVYQPGPHSIGLAVGTGRGLEFKALEEATHAAVYHQLDNPVTESHKAARAELERLMGVAKEHLGESDTFRLSDLAQKAYGPPQSGLAYRFNDIHEFAAGLISDDELRDFLSTIRDPKEGNIFQRAYQKVLDLLGIDKGSVYDKALGELTKLGQDKESWLEAALTNERSPIESPVFIRAKGVMDELTTPLEKEAPAAGVASVRDKEMRERLQARYNAIRGWAAPQHTGASEHVANQLVRYASARIAAPEIAKSMATDVLGSHWKDAMFDRTLGALLVEDRLRAVEKSFRDRAKAEPDPFKRVELETKADSVTSLMAGPMGARIRAAMKDPEYQAAVERHKEIIQPYAQQMHEKLGGKLAGAGPETDAFVNLIAMFGEDGAESTQNMIFGSRKGELSNPRRRGSVFNKETFGTAPGYETSYRKIAERMVRGNYEQVALRDYYKALVDEDLAVVQKAGTPPTTRKGEKLSSVEIGQNRASWWTPNERLYMRENLKPEFMQAVATDQPFQRGAIRLLLDAITEAQVQGPVDFAAHGGNMLAVLASSPGSKSWLGDVLRNGTPIGFADAMLRIGVEGFKAMKDIPEYQKMWADIAQIGAGRDQLHRKGLLEKGIEALGVPEKAAKFMTPNSLSHMALKFIDKGGRIAANKMFDNLVERGLVKDSELDRREFINRLGQYNSRLMGKVESIARELSLSSFIVAGKNMNRQALRSLTMSPGVRAADWQGVLKLRVQQAISGGLLLAVLPSIINSYTVKNWKGRPGTRVGEIDTGKDDEQGRPIKFDLLKLFLKRRAMRNVGYEAYTRAKEQGLSSKDRNNEIIKDIFAGYIHPWMGPSMRFASTALTGRDNFGTGYLQSKNPHDFGANLLAAAVNMNPTVSQLLKDSEEGSATGTTPLRNLAGVVGVVHGRYQSWSERQKAEVEKQFPGRQWEGLNANEKRKVELKLNADMVTRGSQSSELGHLNAGEKAYWSQEQRTQDLKASLLPAQQKWLKDNKLNMPGFGSEVTLGKVRLPSTPEEKEVLAKQMGQAYEKALGDLMASETFQGKDQKGKQDALERKLMWERKKVMRGFKRGQPE